ncbi:hypothetical protein [Herbaspirillum sp. RV1423]|uniref:hypothetical protein n=1 Tax=Herbaspirillum sp. RV1423 TaxID=1443993 RepID=UPI0004BBDAB4|nr:hypothetical protein [Herbaspirillum sp. RV1423]
MMKTRIFSLSLCLALAACTTRAPEAPTAEVKLVTTVSGVDDLLAYHQSLRRLSQQELARELQTLNARQGGGAMLAMQKAMALGLTRDANDLARAQVQLGTVLHASDTDADANALKPLAQLLVSNYAEMRRLSESAEKAGVQARENQRRLDQLSEKLEALKNIERTLPGQSK